MKDIIDIITSLDKNEDVHLARLLILLKAFRAPERSAVEGITKLAKLDFLLRYPSALKKALTQRGVKERIPVDDFEEMTIEAQMVRYRFGPWDHRYRRFLNVLVARGFAKVGVDGNTINIDLTDRGENVATQLSESDAFKRVYERAVLLHKHLNLKARNLMEFIYETFPELETLEFNEEIDIRKEGV